MVCEFCGNPIWSSGFNGRPFCWVKCHKYVEGEKKIDIYGERLADDTISVDGKYYRLMTDKECVGFIWDSAHREHCQCPACKDGIIHASDCAVHNEPAKPNGPCNCGVLDEDE